MRTARPARKVVVDDSWERNTAMRVIIPPIGNETIGMLKTTSVVSVLAMPELLYSAQIVYARTYQIMPLLIVASLWYLVVTTVLTLVQMRIERRYAVRGPVQSANPILAFLKSALRVHGTRPLMPEPSLAASAATTSTGVNP